MGPALCLLLVLVAAFWWRGFLDRGAIPVHMLPGEHGWDGALLVGATVAIGFLRVAAAPLLVLSDSDPAAQLSSVVGSFAVLGGVVGLRARPVRSAAAPLLEDSVWLLGVAAVGLAVHGGPVGALLLGVLAGATALLALLALQVASWGRRSGFWISARPDFQVFAPNPDNRYAMGRIHVGAVPVVTVVPDNGSPYPAIGIYDLRFRRVRLARWEQVRALFDRHGAIRVHVGLVEDLDAGHLSFAVPPGKYFLTVRNYLAERPEAPALPERVR